MKSRILILLISVVLLSACSVSGVSNQTAATKGKALYEAIKSGDIDKAIEQYADKFFEMRSRDQWREQLDDMKQQLGELQSYEITKLSSDTRFSGKFFIFEYKVVYSNGKTWETLTMVNPIDTKDVELIAHKIKTLK